MSVQGNGYGNTNTPFCSHIVAKVGDFYRGLGGGGVNTLELCAGKKVLADFTKTV